MIQTLREEELIKLYKKIGEWLNDHKKLEKDIKTPQFTKKDLEIQRGYRKFLYEPKRKKLLIQQT